MSQVIEKLQAEERAKIEEQKAQLEKSYEESYVSRLKTARDTCIQCIAQSQSDLDEIDAEIERLTPENQTTESTGQVPDGEVPINQG